MLVQLCTLSCPLCNNESRFLTLACNSTTSRFEHIASSHSPQHKQSCISKGLAREQQHSRMVWWLSGPCNLKHRTRTVLSPAVFWGKTILQRGSYTPLCLSTSAHKHISEGEQISPHTQSTLSFLQSAYGANGLHGFLKQGVCCPRASPPYLAPVFDQSGFQLQGHLQEPVLHLTKQWQQTGWISAHSTATGPEQHSAHAGWCRRGIRLEWTQTIVRPCIWSTPGETGPGKDSALEARQ